MARYLLKAPHYLGTRYYEAGAVVDYDGPPSEQMEGSDEAGKARVAERRPSPPHRSRDLLPRLIKDPMQRQIGQPRAAGPPNQAVSAPAEPANPERTVEIVEAIRAARSAPKQEDIEVEPSRYTRGELASMTKDELHQHAEAVGVDVPKSATKDEMIDEIVKAQRRGG